MKKIVLLSLFSCLIFPGASFAAEELFRPDSFFQPIKVVPKEKKGTPQSKAETPASPKTEPSPTPTSPTESETSNLEASVLAANEYVSHDCQYWWIISAIFASLAIGFAAVVKKFPKTFKSWNKIIYYYIVLMLGLVSWIIHYVLHFVVYKYDLAFLCYNYWLVIGFEIIYFWLIYSLVFGFRHPSSKVRRKIQGKNI